MPRLLSWDIKWANNCEEAGRDAYGPVARWNAREDIEEICHDSPEPADAEVLEDDALEDDVLDVVVALAAGEELTPGYRML